MADLTISQKLDSIINTKANIKQAIINKGQQVNDVFDTYAAAIENIQTSPSVENLDTELNTQDNLLNTQNITISNIANALNGKSLPGGGSIDINSVYNLDGFKTSGYVESILNYVQVYPTEIDMTGKTDLSYMFQGCKYMSSVPNLINFDGSSGYVSGMYTFSECSNLKNIDINLPNTNHIKGYSGMFQRCTSVENISFVQPNSLSTEFINGGTDVISEDLSHVFYDCYNLKNINIDNSVIYPYTFQYIFYNCSNLSNLSNITFNVGNYSSELSGVFYNCYNLINFPTFQGKSMYPISSIDDLFYRCKFLNDDMLNNILNRFDLNTTINISRSFSGCVNINALPSQINYDIVTDITQSFGGINVTDINLSISNATSIIGAFVPNYDRYNNETLHYEEQIYESPLANLTLTNCSNIQYIDWACKYCKNLKSVYISDLSTNIYQSSMVFDNCYNLTNVTFENCDFSSVYTFQNMFANCYNLVNCPSLNNTSGSLQDTSYMFANCYNLVNVPTINVEQAYTVNNMFENCYNLSNQSLENILNMRFSTSGYIYSSIGITENQFNIMKNLPSFQNAVNNGWSNEYI